jgi:hypothetical protein
LCREVHKVTIRSLYIAPNKIRIFLVNNKEEEEQEGGGRKEEGEEEGGGRREEGEGRREKKNEYCTLRTS